MRNKAAYMEENTPEEYSPPENTSSDGPERQRYAFLLEKLYALKFIHIAIFTLSLILIGLLLWGAVSKKIENKSKSEETRPVALEVVKAELVGFNKIRILFNDEIDEHVLEHSLAVTPSSNGRITMGDNEKEYYFENSEDFPLATSVLVEVNQGLESKSHLTLLSPQVFWLQTSAEIDQVSFLKDGMYARVISSAEGVPFKISMQAGSRAINNTVSIYKASKEDLLKYLSYKVPESRLKKDGTYDTYDEEFQSNYIEHEGYELVETYEAKGVTQEKELNLQKGIYYLEATKGGQRVGSAFAVINSKGVLVRQDDGKTILSAFDLKSGEKIQDAVQADFYILKDTAQVVQSTTFKEFTSITTPFEKKIDLILASLGDETVLIPMRIRDTLADIRVNKDLSRDTQMFVYTDRPIYKPGDTVFYRGTVRVDNDALYQLPKSGMKVKVSMSSSSYGAKAPYEEVVDVDENGLISGNFIIPKDYPAGDYQSLYMSLDETASNITDYDNYASAYFDIQNYSKPNFELTLTKGKDEYYRNEKIQLPIKGAYFDSKPLGNEKVDYKVYATTYYEQEKKVYNQNFNITQQGGMCGGGGTGDYYGEEVTSGTIDLNEKGIGELSFELSKTKLPKTSQMVTVVVSKNDEKSGNTIQSAVKMIVHAGVYNIFFIPSSSSFNQDEEIVAPFYLESSISGEALPKEVVFEFRTGEWDTDGYQGKEERTGKVSLDENGKGIVRFPASKIKSYAYLTIIAEDKNGNSVETQKSITIKTKEEEQSEYYNAPWWGSSSTQTYLKIISDSNSYVVGDTIRLNITAPKDLDVLLAPERGRIYDARIIHLNSGENKIELPVTAEMSPSITLTFSFFTGGKYYSEGVALNVPSMHKLMQVELHPDKESYQPNDTAYITVVTKDSKGNKIPAQFSLGVVDEAIYGLRKDATPLIHTSFYFYRGRSTNASSSLTSIGSFGGGRGGGGGGGGANNKMVDTLFWAPILSTKENGELVVPIKLNKVKTIWRIQAIASDDATDLGQSTIKIPVK